MSFSKVKKSTYNSVSKALNATENLFSIADNSLSIVGDWVTETKEVRDKFKTQRVAIKAQNSERDLELESQESKIEFHKALVELNESRKSLEELDPEILEKYKHLL